MAAIIQCNDAAAGTAQRRRPSGIDPVHFFVGRKAVDEHDRVAVAFINEGDFNVAVHEMLHDASI